MSADLQVAVRQIVREINAEAVSRADRGLNLLRNAALEVLAQNGSGRQYGRHRASAPGQPPAPDKGNLRRNWRQQKTVTGSLRLTMQITSRQFYADFLEFGTRKMAPRPYRDKIKKKALNEIKALFSSL